MPFLGEIRIFSGALPANGFWANCDGSTLPIAGNEDLATLLGSSYGAAGSGQFILPDLRSRVPMGSQTPPAYGFNPLQPGVIGGQETVIISTAQMAAHAHQLGCSTAAENSAVPTASVPANAIANNSYLISSSYSAMAAASMVPAGSGTAHANLQPYLAIRFGICVVGGTIPV